MSKKRIVKFILAITIFFGSTLLLISLDPSGFNSLVDIFQNWNDSYFHLGAKLRFVCYLLISIGIAFAATATQNINKNYIATPSTLGIGASGAFGFLIAELTHIYEPYFIIAIIFAAGLVPIGINTWISKQKSLNRATNMILVGLALTSLFGVVNYIIRDVMSMGQSSFIWISAMNGQFDWVKLYYVLPMIIVGALMLASISKKIDVISKNDNLAERVAISIRRNRIILNFAVLLIITATTYLIGSVTFLGIAGVNISRMYIKRNNFLYLAFISSIFNLLIFALSLLIFYKLNISMNLVIVIIAIGMFFVLQRKKKGFASA